MKEGVLLIEQLNKPEVLEPGLTTGASRSYAGYGDIYMAEAVQEMTNRGSGQPAEVSPNTELENFEHHIANSLTDKDIKDKEEENNLSWQKWKNDNKEELTESDYSLLLALERHGISPEQFAKNKEFYKINRVLFESKLDPKEIARLIHVWKKFFDSSPQSQEEFEAKWHIIATLAIAAGLSPRGFAKKFKWSSYFDTPPPPTIGGVVKQFIKDFVVEVVAGVAAPVYDSSKTAAENKKLHKLRKQAFARVLWGATTEKREDAGEKITRYELSTQEEAIKIGALPDLVAKISSNIEEEDDDERIKEAEKLLGVKLTDKQKAALLNAHRVGKGQPGKDGNEVRVFNYTEKQIAEKARVLNYGAEKEKSKEPVFTLEQRRMLMEAGLAGDSGGEQEVGEESDGEEEFLGPGRLEAARIYNNLTDEQKNQANDLLSVMAQWEVPLDPNDKRVASIVAQIVRIMSPGERVTTSHLEFAKAKLRERGFFDEGDRAHMLTEEEKQERRLMWDQIVEMARAEGRNVNNPEYAGKVQQAKEHGWSPMQVKIEAPWPQRPSTDREAVTQSRLDEMERIAMDPSEGRRKNQKEKGFSDAIIWTDVQRAHNFGIRDSYGNLTKDPQQIAEYEANLNEGKAPRNLEDLAWQIGKSDPRFSVSGEFPVLEIVYKGTNNRAKPEDLHNPDKTEARVNRSNFMRWVRDRMMYQHDDNPDDELNLFQAVSITKYLRQISLQEIVEHPGVYLKKAGAERKQLEIEVQISETTDPKKREELNNKLLELQKDAIDEELLNEIKREVWLFANSRIFDLKYREVCGVPEDLVSTLQKLFAKSPFTKTVWGNKSSLYWIMSMDQDFAKVKTNKDGKEEEKSDRKVGQAINTAYLAYFNLTDTKRLREILGNDSVLLSREGLKKAVRGLKKDDAEKNTVALEGYMEDDEIDEMFDKNGNVIESKFIKTMNIWSSPQLKSKVESLVRAAVQADITRIAGLYLPGKDAEGNQRVDTLNAHFAETYAYTMSRWTGAAGHNNLGAAGFDAWGGKFQHTENYRAKMADPGVGGGYGNPYTAHMLRMLATDMMTGIRTETLIDNDDRKNNPNRYEQRFFKNNEGKENKAFKTPLEVLEEQHEAWMKAVGVINDLPKNATEEEREKAWEAALEHASNMADSKAGQLVFPGNTMKYFSNDHLKRALDMFNQVINAEEIKLEKFTRIDVVKGVTFERDQFQKAVQERFIKPMRYWARTWKQIDFSQNVRFNAGSAKEPKWEDRSLAEAMFGKEMIDVPEFWTRVDKGTPRAQKYYTRSAKAGEEWEWTWRIPNEISGAEINANRDQLVKQMAMTRLASELWSHVDVNSNDPRYDFRFYETVIAALESIPGGILGDETSLKSSRVNVNKWERFFSANDINWIRKKSKTTFFWTYGIAILQAIFLDGFVKGGFEGIESAGKFVSKTLP